MARRLRQNEIDELLAEAVDDETFRELPGFGEPLPKLDTDPGWFARRKVQELRATDAASATAIQETLAEIWALSDEADARSALEELAERLDEQGPRLRVERVLERWRRTH